MQKKTELTNCVVKLCMLTVILVMAIALGGCRQRITNNDDVSNTMFDPDGTLSEDYESRRDELGLSEAKRPFFPDLGGSDDETDGDFEEPTDIDGFGEGDEEEDVDDEDPEDPKNGGDTPAPAPGPAIPKQPKPIVEKMISVKLDPNGGGCDTEELSVIKGKPYGPLPAPEYEGHAFLGWFTSADGGDKVGSKTEVKTDAAHTLYAHWKSAVTYTVTFDPGEGTIVSGEASIEVTSGGKYGYLPVPEREGYIFDGWFTAPDGGERVEKGDAFKGNGDITLYARWNPDPYVSWKDYLTDAGTKVEEEVCQLESAGVAEKGFLNSCRGRLAADGTEPPAFVIRFTGDMGNADNIGEEALANYPGTTAIVIPNDALNGSKNQKLYYEYSVFCAMHGEKFDDIASADKLKSALGIEDGEIKIYK